MYLENIYTIRRQERTDIANILAIQSSCYPAHLIESPEALLAKSQLSPDTCWLAERNGEVLGYLFAHPWLDDAPPALNVALTTLPENANTVFLHDLAIHPAVRRQGIAQALLDKAVRWARSQQYRKALLVAVHGTQPFWQRQGFTEMPNRSVALQEKLAAYGAGATCLSAAIPDEQALNQADKIVNRHHPRNFA